MALGSAEVTLLEMTSAYSVFPNDGVRLLPRLTQRVTDYSGTVKEENLVDVREVIPQSTARAMVDLLRSVVDVGTAQKAKVFSALLPARQARQTTTRMRGSSASPLHHQASG
jgi:penicillin-binding protein 1A